MILNADSSELEIARQHGISIELLRTLNGLENTQPQLLPRGSELLIAPDTPDMSLTQRWIYGDGANPITVGSQVLVDWTRDGRNIIHGVVIAVALRRGTVRIAPNPAARRFTGGSARWFSSEHIFVWDRLLHFDSVEDLAQKASLRREKLEGMCARVVHVLNIQGRNPLSSSDDNLRHCRSLLVDWPALIPMCLALVSGF